MVVKVLGKNGEVIKNKVLNIEIRPYYRYNVEKTKLKTDEEGKVILDGLLG